MVGQSVVVYKGQIESENKPIQNIHVYAKTICRAICRAVPVNATFPEIVTSYSTAPRLWNDLPIYIRVADSLKLFKSQLKTRLLRTASEDYL